jgi:signal transduction histidine kinase/DNA-binding response OmpR family regulator
MSESARPARETVEVLVAEDSPTQARSLQHILQQQGYHVTVTANGRQALEAARQRKPTIVISDVVMPEMDGHALCRAIKSDEQLRDTPVVLVTTLSDSQDVVRGLECGADNFIRKPYDGRYLLTRIDYLLMSIELRKNQKMQTGVEINLGGRRHFITSERQQILDLLISTYEEAVHLARELKERENALAHSNKSLAAMFSIAEGLNQATTQREVCEGALERALELPGVLAGWITVVDEAGNFVLLASRNLPPALMQPGAMEGSCLCRRKLLAGELDSVTNILECERLGQARGDTQGLRFHASVPIWIGGQTPGVMNLVGSERGLFNDEDKKNLYAVGNQLGVALERARLHERLEQRVEERTAKLAAEVEERRRAEDEVRGLSADLERRVGERTRELETANKELESFSYSVSHDLRAPLRAIDGFSRILEEQHSDRLNEECRRLLGVIRENSRKMSDLIDDLLEFSRLGRKPLSRTRIDMKQLVEAIFREIVTDGWRSHRFVLGSLPPADGDAALLKQVWINLLGNAIKFSSKSQQPVIEVSGQEIGAEIVYCVKDNGAGFDMRYYDRLFGVFQRLHGEQEFAGTGVGLAIVQRVVSRHGGRVWAEGKVNEGATFNFALPKGGGA